MHQHDYFKRGDFPGCMWEVWDSHFGFLAGSGQALVVSEFGDSMESHEGRLWANSIVEYLKQKGATDGFYSVRAGLHPFT